MIITEIVYLESKTEIAEGDFTEIINRLEKNFHSVQEGFIDTELLHTPGTNCWIMIQHWNSMENMKKSSSGMFKNTTTEEFRNSINPEKIQIKTYEQKGIWKK
ncbi:antibiotic biosynthesis monooxygenase [Sebaldella termitidis]|uniref:antibiotic biosynthesis monooxygenase n=1 Tax=Sebaldella termitidis TaxID=826 RepID=UPI003EBA70D4